MERMNSSICVPKGFVAAGTYSGLCRSRVKLDLAMIASRTDCSIVTLKGEEETISTGRAVLYHNGLALPQGQRGQEIKAQAAKAAEKHLGIPAAMVELVAEGKKDQYFRPSLLVNSMSELAAKLSVEQSHLVAPVLDQGSGVSSQAVTFPCSGGTCTAGAAFAEGTGSVEGVCLVTTDLAVSPEQLRQALYQCTAGTFLAGCTLIAMANGQAGSAGSESVTLLAAALEELFTQMGIPKALPKCS